MQIIENNKVKEKVYIEKTSKECDEISIHDSLSIGMIQDIDINSSEIEKWLINNDTTYSFVMNEYYLAFGEENIKIKFFHLFTIIEFCEKEFKVNDKSQKILNKKSLTNIKLKLDGIIFEELEKQTEEIKNSKNKLITRIGQVLGEITDLNRVEKIINILKYMGINSIEFLLNPVEINKDLIQELINLRNKSYHGDKNKDEPSK